MKAHVQLGLIGQAGVNALLNVMVVFNLELEHVSMVKKVTALELPSRKPSVIDNPVAVK